MVKFSSEIYRNWSTDGDSASGLHHPNKGDIRSWGAFLEGGSAFSSQAAFAATNIAPGTTHVMLAGYYSAGDGGAHMKKRATVASAGPGKSQSGDGSWWEVAEVEANTKMFGAKVDGVTDDAAAINNGLLYSSTTGASLFQPTGTSMVGTTITFPNGARWLGDEYQSVVMKLSTLNGAIVKSVNFDSLTGTLDAFAPTVPEWVYIDGITFNGNYQNAGRTAYVQTGGEGLRLFCRKLHLHARVFNMQGVGIWTECPGGNEAPGDPAALKPGFSRESDIIVYTHQTQYEGVVWKGPGDSYAEWLLIAAAGSRIAPGGVEANTKVSSPTYGAVNGGMTYGLVIDGSAPEFGTIHAFGSFGGGGIDLRAGRFNGDLIMAESCNYGGVVIGGNAYGMVDRLDVHRVGGANGDTTEDFIYTSVSAGNIGLYIGSLKIYRNSTAYASARNVTRIDGDFLNIGQLKIDSAGVPGHGLVINYSTAQWINISNIEISRCQGVAPGGGNSAGVFRNGGVNAPTQITIGSGSVRDCDIAFRSVGTPLLEDLNFNYYLNAGQVAFTGTSPDAAQNGQKWDIFGTIDGFYSGSKNIGHGSAATFSTTITTEQTLTIPHTCFAAPRLGKYGVSGIFDSGTGMTLAAVQYVYVNSADATNLTVKVKLSTSQGSDTTPRVIWFAEV